MLSTAALILIVTSKVVLGRDDRVSVKEEIYPLDMAKNSVDDRYEGCTETMANLVKKEYLNKEICSGKIKFSINYTQKNKDNLTGNHLEAISEYTGADICARFNDNVRNGKQKYKNRTFEWYSLHFFLTEAIQILKRTQNECHLTYRGTKLRFNENIKKNTEIRFGSFASSSLKRETTTMFGKESCFEIKTCYGANVTKYSRFNEEAEVLIPPYEKFKVTAIRKKGEKDAWCNTVFVLKSSGIKSNLNCAVASVEPKKFSIKSAFNRLLNKLGIKKS
ncbi:NAD(P)(+)--arginine ADP-ribosyltransferase 1-like [Misgurnus anguillicaudatus]|uniref:NAD(P)(+)--arginine ADP-ribosyltransferase 1-like n=1 Tax=Misgurnus anguillicaudatus TaxID=75329 RepID=UPI003CCFC762